MKLCGMIDSSEGIKSDPAKVDALKYITAPTKRMNL